MWHRLAADGVLVVHLAFVLLVVLGAALVFRWRWVALLHLPAAAWGAWIEASGGLCPLTGIENDLRLAAGESGLSGSFVEAYLLPVLYPSGLTREVQFVLAGCVVAINVALYGWLILRRHERTRCPSPEAAIAARPPFRSTAPSPRS